MGFLRGRRSGANSYPASGSMFAPSSGSVMQGGSAQFGSAHVLSPTSPGFGEPFAAVVPPDILNLDAWMHRENWELGRLAGHEPAPGPRALQTLNKLIAEEEAKGHVIQAIIAIGTASAWRVVHVSDDYSEIHLPLPAWRKILDHLSIPHPPDRSSQPAASYRGIPVTEMSF